MDLWHILFVGHFLLIPFILSPLTQFNYTDSTTAQVNCRSLLLAAALRLANVDLLRGRVRVPKLGELFPRRRQIKLAELLRQLQWLQHDPLLLVVVAHLDEAGQGKVAALWVTFEAVVGQDATQIGVVGEEDAVHVPDLSLVPVGRLEHLIARVHGRQLVRVGLDPHARVVAHGQQIVDDLEAILPAGHIHARNVRQVGELGIVVVLQELQHWDNAAGRDQDLQFIAGGQLNTLDPLGQAVRHVLAKVGEVGALNSVEFAESGWNSKVWV